MTLQFHTVFYCDSTMATVEAALCNQFNGVALGEELSDSGLKVSWLLDTLWKHCPEFREAFGKGVVHEVPH